MSTTLLLAVALPLGWVAAGLPEYDATEIAVGDDPAAVAVTLDDRVVVSLLGTSAVTVSWVDSADFSEGPFTAGLDGDEARCVASGTLDGTEVVFVGGSQLDVIRFDTSEIPATTSTDPAVGLGTGGALLTSLLWDTSTSALYAADSTGSSVHHVDFAVDEPAVDSPSSDWPVELSFVPVDLARFDDSRLLVVGAGALALVDISSVTAPSVTELTAEGTAVAVAADAAGTGWILYDDGEVWQLADASDTGDDDDSAGDDDDDDSAGDDDDSAGDDDDSAADDDDGADDDDDSADDDDDSSAERGDAEVLELTFVAAALTEGTDLVHRDVDGAGHLFVAGGNHVVVIDLATDAVVSDFTLSANTTGLSASSADDGFAYATLDSTGQLAVMSSGPWVRIDSAEPVSISEVTETITVGFTVTFGEQDTETCDYSFAVDADLTGGGTAITSATGTATHGEAVEVVLSGEDLTAGEHRVWLFCEDADGDLGRASFAYTSGGLAAPSSFSLDPDDGQITAEWDDDGTSDTFVVYFSTEDFEDTEEPVLCNSDDTICSPHVVVPSRDGDDDDSADDDDDSTSGTLSVAVDGLTNGTRYYFAVAARDTAGTEGPRTSTLSATPSRRGGAAVLAGDTGGCSCTSSIVEPASGAGALLLLAGIVLFRRRTGWIDR